MATKAERIKNAAIEQLALELDYLDNYADRGSMSNTQLAERLVARLLKSGFKL